MARVVALVTRKGWSAARTVTAVGSGPNGQRPQLMQVLADPAVAIVAAAHRDRLMRCSSASAAAALAAQGRRLAVVDPDETQDHLGQDKIDVRTHLCAWRYGRHSARHRAAQGEGSTRGERAMTAAADEVRALAWREEIDLRRLPIGHPAGGAGHAAERLVLDLGNIFPPQILSC